MVLIRIPICITLALFLLTSCVTKPSETTSQMDDYNVVWNSPSKSSAESMPVGGHSIGCNVWVENGDVLFYAQRSGSFTENNEYHKLGRFRLKLNPNPFLDGEIFQKELKLNEGYVEIKGKADGNEVSVNLWVETLRPVIHLDVQSDIEISAEVAYENWRTETKYLYN